MARLGSDEFAVVLRDLDADSERAALQAKREGLDAIVFHNRRIQGAEAVETAEQLKALTDLGCERFQGFLFARPIPVAEFAALVDSHHTHTIGAIDTTAASPSSTATSSRDGNPSRLTIEANVRP